MEKRELFQIGDIAKMFHLSVGSLRHYEKIGLVTPEYIDRETGYRYYSTGQFECLNTIRYLRVLGMPLPQIADFLKKQRRCRDTGDASPAKGRSHPQTERAAKHREENRQPAAAAAGGDSV